MIDAAPVRDPAPGHARRPDPVEALALAVVGQAIRDARGDGPHQRLRDRFAAQRDARDWLTGQRDPDSLRYWCDLAGLAPDRVMQAAQEGRYPRPTGRPPGIRSARRPRRRA